MKFKLFLIIITFFLSVILTSHVSWGQEENSGRLRIEINIPGRTLTVYQNNSIIAEYPVAVGSPYTPTPTGKYYIAEKSTDPTWYPMPEPVTKVDEEGNEYTEMEQPEPVPPGPDNPLGKYWMGLDRDELGIHSTNNPSSIGYSVSHGCIRMHPYDVPELFKITQIGDWVDIVYKPTKISVEKISATIYLTAYSDTYGRGLESIEKIEADLDKTGIPYNKELTRKVLNEMSGETTIVSLPYEFSLEGETVPIKSLYSKDEFYISQRDWNNYSDNRIDWESETGSASIEGQKIDSTVYLGRSYVNAKELASIMDVEYIVNIEERTINFYSVIMNFNGRPLSRDGKLIKGKPCIAIKTFFNELGLNFQWNNETKEAVFEGIIFKCILHSGRAFISIDALAEYFFLETETIGNREVNLFSPVFSLNGVDVKAFLFKGEIYMSLREVANITGINFKWNSEAKSALIGNKNIQGKLFGGSAYLPLSGVNELALIDINRPETNFFDLNLTKIIVNNNFYSIQGYKDGKNNEVMLLLPDISAAIGNDFIYSQENKTVEIESINLPAFQRDDGIYVSLTDLKGLNNVTIDYDRHGRVISLFIENPEIPELDLPGEIGNESQKF